MPMQHSDATKRRVFHALDNGESKLSVSRRFGVSRKTVYEWVNNRPELQKKLSASSERVARYNDLMPPPLMKGELDPKALRAFNDFAYWRWRYLGRRSTPWQEVAAQQAVEWLHTPDKELVVVNCPPGSGKSTLFTHDIPAWMICRDRTIRILLGHSSSREAQKYVRQLRRTLQRTKPLPATSHSEAAEGCLAVDYGRFKPGNQEAWRQDEFSVMMSIDEEDPDESGLESKEATVAGYGMESEFLGNRANLVVWDDLVTGDVLRTRERIDNQRKWWREEGETRLEPQGCLFLVGQRMGQDDLFAYALSQTYEDTLTPKYRHVIFPAHDDDHCTGDHGPKTILEPSGARRWEVGVPEAKPWPEGCLLDPIRLPWHGTDGLLSKKSNELSVYEVQYQQREVSAGDILVPRVWIDGGRDETGEQYPGCWDEHRSINQLPRGLSQPFHSIITADPSASNYWSVQHWIYHPASESRFLIDLFNDRMDASDLLDWNNLDNNWYGLLEDWVIRARALGAPISHLIFESNACQRWLLQYDHVKRWQRVRGVTIISHQTSGTNKLDPLLGIQSIKERFKHGNFRLPGRTSDGSRSVMDPLVYQATHYQPSKPKAITDDALMAAWFLEWNLPRISKPPRAEAVRLARPSWVAA